MPRSRAALRTFSPRPRRTVPATESASPIEFSAGDRIGSYQLIDKLGEGGMGTAWKAWHVELDKLVAFKLLSKKLTGDATLVERFRRKTKTVGKLEQVHIVRALDGNEFRGTHFLVLEHFDGQDLSQFIKERGPSTVLEACELLRQAALGLVIQHPCSVLLCVRFLPLLQDLPLLFQPNETRFLTGLQHRADPSAAVRAETQWH